MKKLLQQTTANKNRNQESTAAIAAPGATATTTTTTATITTSTTTSLTRYALRLEHLVGLWSSKPDADTKEAFELLNDCHLLNITIQDLKALFLHLSQ
jgi:hypothetical protein